jgi:hypothetical protein
VHINTFKQEALLQVIAELLNQIAKLQFEQGWGHKIQVIVKTPA